MTHPAKDKEREERIYREIMPDAYGAQEEAISWYYYLSEILRFPFFARCIVHRATSPLAPGNEVKVMGMASEEECEHEMSVSIRWKRRMLAVPLMQLEGIQVHEEIQQAIEDWHYWVGQGNEW